MATKHHQLTGELYGPELMKVKPTKSSKTFCPLSVCNSKWKGDYHSWY